MMSTKSSRILLSIEHRLWNELLHYTFEDHSEVQVVGESSDALECLALIVQKNPTIWIHSLPDDGDDLKLLEARALEVAPELVIVRVDPREPVSHMRVPVKSVSHMLTIANRLSVDAPPSYSAL